MKKASVIKFLIQNAILRIEKAPSDNTAALRESTNMDISVVGTKNQLFVRAS